MIGITDTEFMAVRGAHEMGNEYEASIAEFQAALAEMKRERDVARAQLAKATKALAIEQSSAAGLVAQVRALKGECPNSKLLVPTGRKFQDGEAELVMHRDVFDPAFDAKARELGIQNPEDYRG